MNKNDRRHRQAVLSGQEYLLHLGKSLLFYFPVKQVSEILDDYQEYFLAETEHGDMPENAPHCETPKDVLKALLNENPQAKNYFYKWSAIWGIALLLSVFFLFHSGQGMLIATVLMPLSVFGFIHGWSRIRLDADFPVKTTVSKKVLFVQCMVPVLVFLLEAEMQFFIKSAENLPLYIGNLPIGPFIDLEYAFFELLFFLLMIWMGKRMVTLSVQYMPGIIHAMGAMLFCMDTRKCLHSMDISFGSTERIFMLSLIFYGFGLALALLFRLALKYARIRYTRTRQTLIQ